MLLIPYADNGKEKHYLHTITSIFNQSVWVEHLKNKIVKDVIKVFRQIQHRAKCLMTFEVTREESLPQR